MDPQTKARLIEEGSKVVGDLLRVALFRPRQRAYEPLEKEQAPATSKTPKAPVAPSIALPTTEETTKELKRRLAKELYRAELDLSNKLRIANRPCDCLESKHTLGLEATAEELIAQEPSNPVYFEILQWIKDNHPKVTIEAIVSGQYDQEYPRMASEFKGFRKRVMGTTSLAAMIQPKEPGGASNTGNPGTKVRVVPPPARELLPEVFPGLRRRGKPLGRKLEVIDEEEEKRIHELHAQLRESHPEWTDTTVIRVTAEQMGRSPISIHRTIKRGLKHLRRNITPERIKEVLQWRRMGMTHGRIGKIIGVTERQVRRILHRGGERMDVRKEIDDLWRTLYGVSDKLSRPDTLFQLTTAADQLRDIDDDAVLLLEEVAPEEYHYDIGWLRDRAVLAEEVLRTGAWCFQEKPKEKVTARAELLGKCSGEAREVARGFIEGWEGYETRATRAVWEANEMMKKETPKEV